VLLHAFAGSGKTTTAAEFARWYALTGGIEGPVLFTSFERRLPLARVLDKIGETFDAALQRSGVHWGAANDAERRQIALAVLRQIPVLWIWDNVEPITGFPAGTPSEWSAAEQQELRDFLLATRETKARFLITSRRDEQAWLGEMPVRVKTPPMPMQERLQLAGAIAEHRGKRLADLPDLTPLLHFTQGNPLTILVTVGEALRAGIDSKERLDVFVAGLRGGEGNFEDEAAEGRTKSLGASLSYGFANAFNDSERKRLALLHLFQGFADVDAFCAMGDPQAEWALDEVRGLTRDEGIDLLDRAAEIGLLVALGGGYYSVHPALPWYFRDQFERNFAGENAERARRAFVEAIGDLADYYAEQYVSGKRQVLNALMAEEDNLLAAWSLARQYGWSRGVICGMQGLRTLYQETGRDPAWRRLVEAVTPDFVDPHSDLPLPGREDQWSFVTDYRVRIARDERDLVKAERLQRLSVDWARERAHEALATPREQRNNHQRNAIRTLAVSIEHLAIIQRDKGESDCAENFRKAFDLYGAIELSTAQGVVAFNLGVTYNNVAVLRDLDAAESWLKQCLNLTPPGDALIRGKTLNQIGRVALDRSDEAFVKALPEVECIRLLNEASQYHHQALQLLPPTTFEDRGIAYNQLGNIYAKAGDIERALHNYQQELRYCEQSDDIFNAGQTRENMAKTLLLAQRFDDARAYAEAALANYRTFGDRAAEKIHDVEGLLAAIDEAEAEQRGKS